MPRTSKSLLSAVDSSLALLESELSEIRARQLVVIASQVATGTGDINHTFSLNGRFRLVFLRCHFTGGASTASLAISVDSVNGSTYDTTLFTISQAGPGKDAHLRIGSGDTGEPAAWTFQDGDVVRVNWTNPDSGNITWGLELGLASAS